MPTSSWWRAFAEQGLIARVGERPLVVVGDEERGPSALPEVLWWVLLPGAFACLVLSLFYRIEEPLLQYVCSVGLAGFIAMVLFVIFALDRPFLGDMAITPDSYQRVYDHLMKP